jgi:hypothetical protein
MKAKKPWAEKLNDAKPHEVKPAPINIAGMKKGQIMLVPSPRIVDDFIRKIPQGVSMDVRTVRQKLADTYHAQVTCPITMGFHLRTVAEAAFEAFANGAPLSDITPIWRVLDERTTTLGKLSFDPAFILEQRASEGL